MSRQPSTAADKAKAEAFVREAYDNADPPYSPVWLANHRDSILASAVRIETQKRLQAEHKAQFAPARRKAA